jgi:hypothetical protein
MNRDVWAVAHGAAGGTAPVSKPGARQVVNYEVELRTPTEQLTGGTKKRILPVVNKVLTPGAWVESGMMCFDAILWHGGEALAEGSLSECIGRWQRLPRWPRTHAYIQVRGPLGEKNIFYPRDLHGLAMRDLGSQPSMVAAE